MGKLLSVIIPTYNMETYLPRCLGSFVSIKKELDDLQIIVVNDGSKDASSKIAHEYEAKYPNAIVVIDKENGNYGSCVNVGLKYVQGKYVKVVDADDWVDSKELEKLLVQLQYCDSDMVVTPYQKVYENSDEIQRCPLPLNFDEREQDINDFFSTDYFSFLPMHMISYKTSILRTINYQQTEGISYTDSEWIFKPIFHVKTVQMVDADVYRYLLGREGQTMDPKVILRSLNQELIVLKSQLEYRKNNIRNIVSTNVKKYVDFTICRKSILIYTQMLLKASNSEFDASVVERMESMMKELAPELYDKMAYFDARCIIVRYWRKNKKLAPPFFRNILCLGLNLVKLVKISR